MSISTANGLAFGASTPSVSSNSPFSRDRRADAKSEQVISDFRKEAKKTPADRIRENILKKHHLTEETFNNLSADKQAGILREIEDALNRTLKTGKTGAKTTDVNANVIV